MFRFGRVDDGTMEFKAASEFFLHSGLAAGNPKDSIMAAPATSFCFRSDFYYNLSPQMPSSFYLITWAARVPC